MPTTVNLRRILDRKQWEPCAPCPVLTTTGSFIVSSNLHDQYQFLITAAATAYMYDPSEDGWTLLPSPALAGAFGAGATGARHPFGPSGTATGGTTTTIQTNLAIQRDLRGYTVRITAGPNAGEDRVIAGNTVGANSVITVTQPYGTAITSASQYQLVTGRVYVVNAGAMAAGSFKVYDVALNTWTTLTQTGLPTIGTDAKLVPTPGYLEDFATGTATAGAATTLTNTAKSWTTNQWTNYQVRIVGGAGAGQTRTIASNTATVLTVSAAWTVNPNATSQYVIEGNSDFLYLLGNNAVTMYRYSISGNSWTTLSPGTARTGNPIAGMSANWIWQVNDPEWKDESNCLNGRYIYSFRGNTSSIVDRYNIATNAWENDITYAPKSDPLTAANGFAHVGNFIYINLGATGRMLKYNIVEQRMEPFSQLWYAQSTALTGDRLFDVTYTDGGTTLKWLYTITNNQNMLFRCLIF
jgi:hypothetical protein